MYAVKGMWEILRDLREDSDLSQRDVAEKLGVTPQQYSQYENGVSEIPLHRFIKLVEIFDVSADYLLGRTQRPENRSFRNVQVTKDCSCTALLNAVLSLPEDGREAVVEYVRLQRLKERAKKP